MNRIVMSLALCAPAVGIFFSSPSKAAVTFEDSSLSMRMRLEATGAQVCVLKPKTLQEEGACEGIDVAAAEPTIAASVKLMAFFRYPESMFVLNVSTQPKPGSGLMTKEEAKDFVRGATAPPVTTTRGRADGAPFDLLVINDLQVIRYISEGSFGSGIDAMVNFVIVGKQGLATVMFMTNQDDLKMVEAAADEMIGTLKWVPGETPATWPEGESAAFTLGYQLGKLTGPLLVLIGICVGTVFVYRSSRRKRQQLKT